MLHRQPMHEACGRGAENSLQHRWDGASPRTENRVGVCPCSSPWLQCQVGPWGWQEPQPVMGGGPQGGGRVGERGSCNRRGRGRRARKPPAFSRLQPRAGVSFPRPLAVRTLHSRLASSSLSCRAKHSRDSFLMEIQGQEMWAGIFSP